MSSGHFVAVPLLILGISCGFKSVINAEINAVVEDQRFLIYSALLGFDVVVLILFQTFVPGFGICSAMNTVPMVINKVAVNTVSPSCPE